MELAARIGQTLLEKNKVYEDKNETLEELLSQANERVGHSDQLRMGLTEDRIREQIVYFNPCHAEPGYTLPLQTV